MGGREGGDFVLTPDITLGGTEVTRYDNNIAAIRLLKDLEADGRKATREEQAVLAKYCGWGGLSRVFKLERWGSIAWTDRANEVKELLTETEYKNARASTLNAHYTDPIVTNAVWKAVLKMGYTGGPTLEPAMGTGMFYSTRPAHLPVQMNGVELDSISGRISRQLYPTANVKISGFEDVPVHRNTYNLAISNVPFGNYQLRDTTRVDGLPQGLDKSEYSIHDFYFLKNLHGVKEGGLVAFVTSRYTMDKQDSAVRERMAEMGDFVGAIRLPNTSFRYIADTNVVTDIVFMQKRPPEKEMSDLTREFIGTAGKTLTNEDGTEREVFTNNYYNAHPEMILGTESIPQNSGMYGGYEYTVESNGDLAMQLDGAIMSLPEGIMRDLTERNTTSTEYAELYEKYRDYLPGSYLLKNGVLCQKCVQDGMVTIEPAAFAGKDAERKKQIVRELLPIRDCVRSIFEYHRFGDTAAAAEKLKELNERYDRFVFRHGYLNVAARDFKKDPDYSLLLALEEPDHAKNKGISKDADKHYKKSDLFSGKIFIKSQGVDRAETPFEAMLMSLTRHNSINIPYMAEMSGIKENVLIKELTESGNIFIDPVSLAEKNATVYLPREKYLSGNVREKLRYVKNVVEQYPELYNNVDTLEAVMPPFLDFEKIRMPINNPLLKEEYLNAFVAECIGADIDEISVKHSALTGAWGIDKYPRYADNSSMFIARDTKDPNNSRKWVGGNTIFENVLNGKALDRYESFKDENGVERKVKNEELTADVKRIAADIQDRWANWIWKDPGRRADLETRYNDIFNCRVSPELVHPLNRLGADGRLPGCAYPHPLREHQLNAIYRVISNPQAAMFAHTVGAGKTLEFACSAMELKRLGIRNKPMIVVPNHLINQFAREMRQAYPLAKMLIADDDNWGKTADDRKQFINNVATNDWDIVVMRGSTFERVPCSKEYTETFYNQKLNDLRKELRAAEYENRRQGNKSKSFSVKNLEKAEIRYQKKLDDLLAGIEKYGGTVCFEDMGIDHLFVDEADLYKNLEYTTRLGQNIKGLGDPDGSFRAFDMLQKIRYTQGIGGGVTFGTGTPISNTLVEAYTMMRYLQPELLKDMGVSAFDDWVHQFSEISANTELNNTGTGWKTSYRVMALNNYPELMDALCQVWDIKSAATLEKLGLLTPNKKDENGVVIPKSGNLPFKNEIPHMLESTPLIESFKRWGIQREEAMKELRRPDLDNVLVLINDGKKVAADPRLINPHLSDAAYLKDGQKSKLHAAAEFLAGNYKKYEKEGYTTAVFWDEPCAHRHYLDENGKEKSEVIFDGVNVMIDELVKMGIPREQIGDIRTAKKPEDRQKMFEKVNNGEIRIIFGNVQTMGAGVNMQRYLRDVVFMNQYWKPRDRTQAVGRAYRVGGIEGKNEIDIHTFVTKGTVETGMLALNETKQDFINKFDNWTGSKEDRENRVIEEESSTYRSFKELSIDNPLFKESVELGAAIKELKLAKQSYQTDYIRHQSNIAAIPKEIERIRKHFDATRLDLEARRPLEEVEKEKFNIIVGGKEFKKEEPVVGEDGKKITLPATRVRAGEEIARTVKAAWDTYWRELAPGDDITRDLGSYGGFRLQFNLSRSTATGYALTFEAIGRNGKGHKYTIGDKYYNDNITKIDPVGICVKLHNCLYNEIDRIQKFNLPRIESLEHSLEESKKVTGVFPHEELLREKVARGNVVRAEIEAIKEPPTTKYDFPWDGLESMSPEQIQFEVKCFYDKYYELERMEIENVDSTPEPMEAARPEPVHSPTLNSTESNIGQKPVKSENVEPSSPTPVLWDANDQRLSSITKSYLTKVLNNIDDAVTLERHLDSAKNALAEAKMVPLREIKRQYDYEGAVEYGQNELHSYDIPRGASPAEIKDLMIHNAQYLTDAITDKIKELNFKTDFKTDLFNPERETVESAPTSPLPSKSTAIPVWDSVDITDNNVKIVSKNSGINESVALPTFYDIGEIYSKYNDFVKKFNVTEHKLVPKIDESHSHFDKSGYTSEVDALQVAFKYVVDSATTLRDNYSGAALSRFNESCNDYREMLMESMNYKCADSYAELLRVDMRYVREMASKTADKPKKDSGYSLV